MKAKRQVGARELKTRLGQYIRAAREGETIVVTERGEAVAELRPIPRVTNDIEARLAWMAEAGLLTRGSGERRPTFRPIALVGESLSRTLAEEREDRF